MFRRNHLSITLFGIVAAAAVLIPLSAQDQAYRAPRTSDGKPDLSGIWQAMNTANWDLAAHAAQQAR